MDQTGCSDGVASDLSSVISEFSFTPNTSVCLTPESSPINQRNVVADDTIPSTSTASVPAPEGGQSRGKNLSLLMKAHGRDKYYRPRDSLYFREKMVKT